ncbi:MAG TPA: tetratricopeptide repeat protein, partial [Planctomycetes bacterium]|nr:tetratricopeptide repeat protein [Planctomycetota bacterium]
SLLLSASLFAQSSGEAFAKAKRLELEEAQVQKALPLYELVLQDPQAPKGMKAQALYRQAICYLKLEEYAKAGATLARLEKSYPNSDQAVHAKLLRRSLGTGAKALSPRRDLNFEVQDLLVSGVAQWGLKAGKRILEANLQRLRLLGPTAIPALRKALKVAGDTKVKSMAVLALAEQGDEKAFEPLLDRLARPSPFILEYNAIALMTRLCRENPENLKRLKKAFSSSKGMQKGRILEILSGLHALDSTSDPRNFLQAKNPALQRSAWKVYGMLASTSPAKSREFIETLLEAWTRKTGDRNILATTLVQSLPIAERAGEPLLHSWSKQLLKEAKDPSFFETLVKSFHQNWQKPQLPIRMALIEALFQRGSPDPDKFEDPTWGLEKKPKALYPVLSTLLQKTKPLVVTNPRFSLNVLKTVASGMSELPPSLLRRLLAIWTQDGFLDLCLQQEKKLGFQPLQSFLQPFLWIFERRGKSLGHFQLCYELAMDKEQPWAVRMAAFMGITTWVHFKPQEVFKKALKVLFELQDHFSPPAAWKGIYNNKLASAYLTLLFHPGALTLRQAFRRLLIPRFRPAGGPSINRVQELIAQAQKGGGRFALYLDLIRDPKVLHPNLVNWIDAFELKPEERGKALMALWKRLPLSLRGKIISQFPFKDTSISFFLAQISEDAANIPVRAMRQWSKSLPTSKRPGLLSALLPIADPRTKIEICQDLESLASPVAAPALIQLLVYPDLKIRRAAESALESIRNIKKNQKAWKEWYEALQKKERK